MLTQTVPSVINALQGVLPDQAVKALVQALGNCNQPLTHRGMVNFSPPLPGQDGPGYFAGNQWNPVNYYNIFPTRDGLGPGDRVDIPGWGGGRYTTNNYAGDSMSFPQGDITNVLNTYQGGPNVYNAGDTYNNNSYSNTVNTNNVNTTNINTTTINNFPVPPGGGGGGGPGGPQGGGPIAIPIPVPIPGPPGGSQGNTTININITNAGGRPRPEPELTVKIPITKCVDGEFKPAGEQTIKVTRG